MYETREFSTGIFAGEMNVYVVPVGGQGNNYSVFTKNQYNARASVTPKNGVIVFSQVNNLFLNGLLETVPKLNGRVKNPKQLIEEVKKALDGK